MSSKTKIVVLHMKEVIYTLLFLLFFLILGILLFFMFGPGKSLMTNSSAVSRYVPGVYRTSIQLNNNQFDMEVTVDADQIQSIKLVNLSESTTAMFPLMEPALETLANQIYASQSLENIQYPEEQKYTSQLLLQGISAAISKASPN